jgi:hypothetical protein
MTIIATVTVVLGVVWFVLAGLFWMLFREDERVHPIYREGMAHVTQGTGGAASRTREVPRVHGQKKAA